MKQQPIPTPGPWTWHAVKGAAGGSIRIENESGITVAACPYLDAEGKATATLIAAAPDLLSIIRKLAGFYSSDDPYEVSCIPFIGPKDSEVLNGWREALEAIAKAEGKSS